MQSERARGSHYADSPSAAQGLNQKHHIITNVQILQGQNIIPFQAVEQIIQILQWNEVRIHYRNIGKSGKDSNFTPVRPVRPVRPARPVCPVRPVRPVLSFLLHPFKDTMNCQEQ